MNGIRVCEILWVAFLVLWVVWGMRTKATRVRESMGSQLTYVVPTIAAYYLMFSDGDRFGPLGTPLLPKSTGLDVLGAAITVAGLSVAVWARACIGRNWSSSVTVKVEHQLITNGPYRWVRHPIYSGMILALLGTAAARDQPRGLLAVLLLYIGFKIKSRIEERFMTSVFGAEYESYRRDTGAILPRVRPPRISGSGG